MIDPKYIEKMVDLLGLKHVRPRKVPSNHEITTADNTEKLDETRCSVYRAVLGCLLYVAPDRLSSPTERQYQHLRYAVEYLYTTRDYHLVLHCSGKSFLDETTMTERSAFSSERPRLLEAVSDADWAGVHDRHSISCGQLYMDGNLMFSYLSHPVSPS